MSEGNLGGEEGGFGGGDGGVEGEGAVYWAGGCEGGGVAVQNWKSKSDDPSIRSFLSSLGLSARAYPITRSPFLKRSTPSPTSWTSPATSQPMIAGNCWMKIPASCWCQSTGLMAMAAFLTIISPGPAVGIGAGPTSSGVLACLSQAAWFFGVDMLGELGRCQFGRQ